MKSGHPTGQTAPKVQVTIYHESLCDRCIHFMTTQLKETYDILSDIFSITFVPSGNAKLNGSKIACQHGPDECYGNNLEVCSIDFCIRLVILSIISFITGLQLLFEQVRREKS